MTTAPRRIEPRTLKGFRDYPPALAIAREELMERARAVYRSYGYVPIDTPALEYTEILLGKGGEEADKQLFRFEDAGGRDVALRFDLTVPFARFAAQHVGSLGTPFKRYHLAPVWRGENPQRGRFREFVQCDFDTIGTTSNAADVEVSLVIADLLPALGFERFTVRVNNRKLLNGLLDSLGLADRAGPVLRALDKLPKVGREAVVAEMGEVAGVERDRAERVLGLVSLEGTNAEVLDRIEAESGGADWAAAGLRDLRQLLAVADAVGVPEGRIRVDLSIARGLDYYTGTVYETFLDELPGIGSVCSGGRYDDLASLYTRQVLPGVGASLGLDRLLAAMEQLELLSGVSTAADVLVTQFDAAHLAAYAAAAARLRRAGIGAEVYPDPRKLGAQLGYADKRGFPLALIAGPDELERGVWQLADLRGEGRARHEVSDADLPTRARDLLARSTA
ncbi:MAG: histidine--tRNA ligase [Acidimicrobiia bacterium]|nr:histidine--tRNA ligase [Acidimicrobiia bacterium]